MRRTWAVAGVDLHVEVRGTRVRAGLEEALREAVRTGRLHPATRLPASRALAVDLGVARNTVAEAYGQLVAEGWLVARPGSGTTVAAVPSTAASEVPSPADSPGPRYDLRPGSPNLALFPRTAWLRSARRAMNAVPDRAFGYGDPRGRVELRTAVADYLARARGVHVTADRVVICPGFSRGLAVLCQVLCDRGAAAVAVEGYGHASHRQAIVRAGLGVEVMSVDDQGARVHDPHEAQAILLTPAHQFPVGVTLSTQRRDDALRWAERSESLVIEDDYDGEFRYDRQPVGALQARAPERVVYAGSISKTLAPGIRLGWLVPPADLVDDIAEAQAPVNQTSVIDQLTLADFISAGDYDRQVRRCRLAYRRRRDRLAAVLDRRAPLVRIGGIAAGLQALLEMPEGITQAQALSECTTHGVAVDGLSNYAARRTEKNAIVVGYATPPDHAFTTAITRLSAAMRAATGS